jgi:hypothetical protein
MIPARRALPMNVAVTYPTLSERLAAYVCEERFNQIDPDVIAPTKWMITYNIGLALRIGRSPTVDANMALGVVRRSLRYRRP